MTNKKSINMDKLTWRQIEQSKTKVGMVLTCEALDDQLNEVLQDKRIAMDELQRRNLIAIRKALRTFLRFFYRKMNAQAELDLNEKSAALTEYAQFLSIVNTDDMDVILGVMGDIEKQYTELSKKKFEQAQLSGNPE